MGWSDPIIQVKSSRLNRILAPVSKIYATVLLVIIVGMAVLGALESESSIFGATIMAVLTIVFVGPIGYAISHAYQYYSDRQYVSDTAAKQREIEDPSVSAFGYAVIFIVLFLVLNLSAVTSQLNNYGSLNVSYLFGRLIGVVILTYGIGKVVEWNRKRKMS